MVKLPGKAVLVVSHPATLPLDRVLLRMTDAVNNSVGNSSIGNSSTASKNKPPLKNAKLRVTLGGSICPPLPWQVPAGVNNYKELVLLAHSTAAQQLALPATDLACEWSPSTPSVLGAMPLWWIQSLQAWASHHRAKVTSLQPLWAIASHCKLACNPAVQGLCIYEEDGAVSLTSPHIPIDDTAILKMKFGQAVQLLDPAKLQNGPATWPQHWQTA